MTAGAKRRSAADSWLRKFAAAPHIAWSVLFTVIPLLFVIYYAFTDRDFNFTLANVKYFFTNYMGVFLTSINLALFATVFSLLIGYPAAYFIARAKASSQKILVMLIMLPMWMNFLIRTYALMLLMQDTGIINSFLSSIGLPTFKMLGTEGAVVFGMVYDYLPYMIMPIYSVMVKLDHRLVEAAYDLGCNPFGVLKKVIIPQSMPGVISGIMMVFVPSVSTFYISQKLSTNKVILIGDVIEQQVYISYNHHMAAAISLVLMVILLVSMFIINRFSGEDEGGLMP